jgi:hypothetical protein
MTRGGVTSVKLGLTSGCRRKKKRAATWFSDEVIAKHWIACWIEVIKIEYFFRHMRLYILISLCCP